MRAVLLPLPLLAACLSDVLEAPYVVSTQLGPANGLVPSGRDTVLVATDQGVWEADEQGGHTKIFSQPVQAIAAHPDAVYLLSGSELAWGPLPTEGPSFVPAHHLPAPGVIDMQAWCGPLVLLADPSGITAWDRDTGETFAWATGMKDLRSIALGGSCEEALAVTAHAVLAVSPGGTRTLADGLINARAAASDAQGRLWVVAGAPPVLSRIENGALEEFARYLGDPRDVHIGIGGRWPSQNLYLADGEGRLSYVRLP